MQHAGTQTIKTIRLTLRKIELADADMMFRNWANDDEVSCYMRWRTHKNTEETRVVIRNWFDGYKDQNRYHWGVCLDDEMIGSVGVMITAEYDYKVEIGYCIGRKWWGQNYTSEALKAVLDYMFTNTDIERIEAYHSVLNPASGKMMVKAGMRREGFARHNIKTVTAFRTVNYIGLYGKIGNIECQ